MEIPVTSCIWREMGHQFHTPSYKVESNDTLLDRSVKHIGNSLKQTLVVLSSLVVAAVTPLFLSLDATYNVARSLMHHICVCLCGADPAESETKFAKVFVHFKEWRGFWEKDVPFMGMTFWNIFDMCHEDPKVALERIDLAHFEVLFPHDFDFENEQEMNVMELLLEDKLTRTHYYWAFEAVLFYFGLVVVENGEDQKAATLRIKGAINELKLDPKTSRQMTGTMKRTVKAKKGAYAKLKEWVKKRPKTQEEAKQSQSIPVDEDPYFVREEEEKSPITIEKHDAFNPVLLKGQGALFQRMIYSATVLKYPHLAKQLKVVLDAISEEDGNLFDEKQEKCWEMAADRSNASFSYRVFGPSSYGVRKLTEIPIELESL